DFGEWGGVTWFKDKSSNKQYEVGVATPIINKFNNSYYLTEGHSIIKVDDPKRLDVSKQPYDYKIAVLSGRYWREGNYSTNGAEILFEREENNFFTSTFSIGTTFVLNNKLYHLYTDSLTTQIGTLQENEL